MLSASATPVAQPFGNAYQNQELAAAIIAANMAGLRYGAQRSMLRNARAVELADRGIFDLSPDQESRLNDVLAGIANGVAQSNVVGNFVSNVISFLPFSGALGNLINGAVSGLANGITTANANQKAAAAQNANANANVVAQAANVAASVPAQAVNVAAQSANTHSQSQGIQGTQLVQAAQPAQGASSNAKFNLGASFS
ncbi:hypothetical protein AX774_g5943 [Zancudomyces culisetae]|uniref:Uncharacterized protein n=1 Tax=Zancudomyces culisetae TaxID=1213189 RepID=A0A1R1PI15_ZANCU|nr:hypothetical protein AX774_g5943 [Zancudomyces culisetae]|eukprot:OMH80621.1 hypothetical protein AX774_g5943 [Zancudomyces culisetae]